MSRLTPAARPQRRVLEVRPDDRYDTRGNVKLLVGYDAGLPAPPRPDGGPGTELVAASADDLVAVLTEQRAILLPDGGGGPTQRLWSRSLRAVLGWLQEFPGEDWEQRWLASGADEAPRAWARQLEDAGRVIRDYNALGAVTALVHARVLRPSYSFLLCTHSITLYRRFWRLNDPQEFGRLRALEEYRVQGSRVRQDAEACLIRIMIRTGKPLLQLTGDELLDYADLVRASGRHRREHLAWELMVALGPFAAEPPTLRAVWSAKGNSRQHSTAALVGRYGVPPGPVRDLLVDYLQEIRPGVDYSTLENIAGHLTRVFWMQILEISPHQQDLRLSSQTMTAWRERLAITPAGQPRADTHGILFTIRAFYRDLQQWAQEDPARWARWAVPNPIRDADVRAHVKHRRAVKARMQQRTRTLTGLLPTLTASATGRKDWSTRLLAAAADATHGQEFILDNVKYLRHDPPVAVGRFERSRVWAAGPPELGNARGLIDVTALEQDCFWAWALIETLRLTGCRIEEVLELTQLSIRHYTPPDTGTVVPLLHIAPSKLDLERLIPMSPEMVAVLVQVQRRAKGEQTQIPLSVRYDHHERVHGSPLPHLFARRIGARQEVLSTHYVRSVLGATAAAAGLTDDGQLITFTPHDFRRLFTTEMVGAGLPLHIAAALLGHLDLDTTRSYAAVFPEQVIRRHQEFIARRRALNQAADYRDPTPAEWAEFEQHFQLRRVALGDCFRPYGTPCVHEHACERCAFLRLDPEQAPRLDQMRDNVQARLAEASQRRWLGEVAALEESLRHIERPSDVSCRVSRYGLLPPITPETVEAWARLAWSHGHSQRQPPFAGSGFIWGS